MQVGEPTEARHHGTLFHSQLGTSFHSCQDEVVPKRTPLSKARVVEAAIAILDADGEAALTFRALAAHLETGAGAIYWYVANKDDLLAAAADQVIDAVVRHVKSGKPRATIRAIMAGVFDAIDSHPWVGAQLSREPWQPAMLRMLEAIGTQVTALGVPARKQFDATTALVGYVMGLAGQYAAAARLIAKDTKRPQFLADVAARWKALDKAQYPFVRRMAARLPGHDDRAQFLAGIELILAGIGSPRIDRARS